MSKDLSQHIAALKINQTAKRLLYTIYNSGFKKWDKDGTIYECICGLSIKEIAECNYSDSSRPWKADANAYHLFKKHLSILIEMGLITILNNEKPNSYGQMKSYQVNHWSEWKIDEYFSKKSKIKVTGTNIPSEVVNNYQCVEKVTGTNIPSENKLLVHPYQSIGTPIPVPLVQTYHSPSLIEKSISSKELLAPRGLEKEESLDNFFFKKDSLPGVKADSPTQATAHQPCEKERPLSAGGEIAGRENTEGVQSQLEVSSDNEVPMSSHTSIHFQLNHFIDVAKDVYLAVSEMTEAEPNQEIIDELETWKSLPRRGLPPIETHPWVWNEPVKKHKNTLNRMFDAMMEKKRIFQHMSNQNIVDWFNNEYDEQYDFESMWFHINPFQVVDVIKRKSEELPDVECLFFEYMHRILPHFPAAKKIFIENFEIAHFGDVREDLLPSSGGKRDWDLFLELSAQIVYLENKREYYPEIFQLAKTRLRDESERVRLRSYLLEEKLSTAVPRNHNGIRPKAKAEPVLSDSDRVVEEVIKNEAKISSSPAKKKKPRKPYSERGNLINNWVWTAYKASTYIQLFFGIIKEVPPKPKGALATKINKQGEILFGSVPGTPFQIFCKIYAMLEYMAIELSKEMKRYENVYNLEYKMPIIQNLHGKKLESLLGLVKSREFELILNKEDVEDLDNPDHMHQYFERQIKILTGELTHEESLNYNPNRKNCLKQM